MKKAKKLKILVESKGKARVFKTLLPNAEIITTKGSVYELAWEKNFFLNGNFHLKWKPKRNLPIQAGDKVLLALDPDEVGEVQSRLIEYFYPGVSFRRVFLFGLNPQELQDSIYDPAPASVREFLFKKGITKMLFDRLLATYFTKIGLKGFGRSQAGVLHLLKENLFQYEYIHSFFWSGPPNCLHLFSSSGNLKSLVIQSIAKKQTTLPPLSTSRLLARIGGTSQVGTLERLYLNGCLSYPRVSPKTWDDLPPPIYLINRNFSLRSQEVRVINTVLQAHKHKKVLIDVIKTDKGNIKILPERLTKTFLDLTFYFATGNLVNLEPLDVLIPARVKLLKEKPISWILTEIERRAIARPSYLHTVFQKLQHKKLISYKEGEQKTIELTALGEEVQEKLLQAFPELAAPDFGQFFHKKIQEDLIEISSPNEARVLDSEFKEILNCLQRKSMEEVNNVEIRKPEVVIGN